MYCMVLLFIYIFVLTSIMKNIVLYTIPLLLFVFSESVSQKPTIDLLPSNHERPHPEARVDTSNTKDTLIMKSTVVEKITEAGTGIQHGEVRKKGNRKGWLRGNATGKPGLHPDSIFLKLVSKKVKPPRILIFYITALNK